ncbi:hypothetical protein GALMADRAFT_916151 [Galerina marginata CBS 339.88]|uniref:Uncharacterized protein n=1 Tax=Galerina marginata (strain CBS 339.88) TaxID=685588 RepID=A0A067SPG3_GALM3|nr:hypothetical protein GALMADRAFT_916151 [Galerina marginata CBS 339.88]
MKKISISHVGSFIRRFEVVHDCVIFECMLVTWSTSSLHVHVHVHVHLEHQQPRRQKSGHQNRHQQHFPYRHPHQLLQIPRHPTPCHCRRSLSHRSNPTTLGDLRIIGMQLVSWVMRCRRWSGLNVEEQDFDDEFLFVFVAVARVSANSGCRRH